MWPWRGRWGRALMPGPQHTATCPLVSHPDTPAPGSQLGEGLQEPPVAFQRGLPPPGPSSLWGLHSHFWGAPGTAPAGGSQARDGTAEGWQQAGLPRLPAGQQCRDWVLGGNPGMASLWGPVGSGLAEETGSGW